MTEILFVVLAMFGVIGLMLLVIFGMKKMLGRISGNSGAKGMKVISVIGVGQDKSLAAVRAGKKNLLVGISPSGINLLCDLDEEDMQIIEHSGDASRSNDESMAGKSFAECFKYNLSKLGGEFIRPYENNNSDDDNEKDE